MAFGGAPDRDLRSDVLKAVFGSRIALAVIFAGFLVLGIVCVWLGGTVLISVGTSLIASALISFATLLIDQIRNGEQMRAADLAKAGLLAAYERRDLGEYDNLVGRASQIDIAGYTLKSFSETNASILRDRATAGNAVTVRVLVVNPDDEAAKQMEHAEGLSKGAYQASFRSLQGRLSGIGGVQIRTIRRHLPMMIYRIDQTLYTGPFPTDGRSRMALTLKLGLGGWLFLRQRAEFDALWEMADTVTRPEN